MTKTEREQLNRLYNCLYIPGFSGKGRQSASIEGAVSFARDCEFALPLVKKIIYSIGSGDSEAEDPESLLEEFERWLENRRSADWT